MSRRRERERTKLAKDAPKPMRAVVEEQAEPETLEEYCTEIRKLLDDVTADAVFIQALITSKQTRMVDLDAGAREAMAAQAASDRLAKANRARAAEELGHAWFARPDETSLLHGPTAAPGDATAFSVGAEIVQTLHRIAIDITDYDIFPSLTEQVGLEKISRTASRIRFYLGAAGDEDLPAIKRSYRALAHLVAATRVVIDGHGQRTRLKDPCPHCGLETLVVFWDWQTIVCDRTTSSPHLAPCICSDPVCACKHRPVAHRHTWYGPASQLGSVPTWSGLRNRLNTARAAKTPTKKK